MLRRSLLIGASAGLILPPAIARPARALTGSQYETLLGNGVPSWVLRGTVPADLDFNFAQGLYYQAGRNGLGPSQLLTTVRASVGYAADASGNWTLFGNNVARITNQGLLVEEAGTNLFLNSATPATQTITVVNASVYTVSVYGTASIVLSGAGTGTVTQGNPVTFTAGSTSLVCTVSGAGGTFQNGQVELGAFATSPVRTTSGAGARAADAVAVTSVVKTSAPFLLFADATPIATNAFATTQFVLSVSDGTTNNIYQMARAVGNTLTQIVVGGVLQYSPAPSAWGQNVPGKLAMSSIAGPLDYAAFNGTLLASGVGGGTFAGGNVYIGGRSDATRFFNGTIRRVVVMSGQPGTVTQSVTQ